MADGIDWRHPDPRLVRDPIINARLTPVHILLISLLLLIPISSVVIARGMILSWDTPKYYTYIRHQRLQKRRELLQLAKKEKSQEEGRDLEAALARVDADINANHHAIHGAALKRLEEEKAFVLALKKEAEAMKEREKEASMDSTGSDVVDEAVKPPVDLRTKDANVIRRMMGLPEGPVTQKRKIQDITLLLKSKRRVGSDELSSLADEEKEKEGSFEEEKRSSLFEDEGKEELFEEEEGSFEEEEKSSSFEDEIDVCEIEGYTFE
ncbi:hypothetical protein DFH27DRAFT_602140 [Peziza echinospora]|nr:hypothetical protein DFH27DRAFT_602140 [Peziza echinospora]